MGQDLIHELSSRQDAKVINRSLDGDFGGAVRALQYKGISTVDYNVEKERRGCVQKFCRRESVCDDTTEIFDASKTYLFGSGPRFEDGNVVESISYVGFLGLYIL